MRLVNVYDINARTYMLKLARTGEDGEKVFVVLESGIRVHMTQFARDKNQLPSNFSMKLRKHLRGKRLDEVTQLGIDRTIDFAFGSGEAQHHLILEMYSQGNIVLTDAKYQVLTSLRTYKDEAKGLAVMPGLPYPVQMVRLYEPFDAATLQAALTAATDKFNLKNLLAQLLPYGPMLAEHCLLLAGLQPTRKPVAEPLGGTEIAALMEQVRAFDLWLAHCKDRAPKGYIILKPSTGASHAGHASAGDGAAGTITKVNLKGDGSIRCPEGMVYDDYDPLLLQQKAAKRVLEFETFDAALDEFYSKIEQQRMVQQQVQQEKQAHSRVDKVRADQDQRLAALEREAAAAELHASVIEANLDAVNDAIGAVNAQLATGIAWSDLERLIQEERAKGAPLAMAIAALNLAEGRAMLVLDNWIDADDSDDSDDDDDDRGVGRANEGSLERPRHRGRGTKPRKVKVDVDLNVNAYTNAKFYFEQKKALLEKRERTMGANSKVLKQVEAKTAATLQKTATVKQIHEMRKVHWFEKFNWFISSEGYLVLSGRDAQQSELLVKRYLKPGDVYVHADLHGAASTLVKNHLPGREVSPIAINQAGTAAVCRSKAWDSKIVTSAWWVHAHQVSKTAPTGEYLSTGSFMVRGRKNYLPPSQLVMGFGFLFRVDEDCIARHAGERCVLGGGSLLGASGGLNTRDAGAGAGPQDDAEADAADVSARGDLAQALHGAEGRAGREGDGMGRPMTGEGAISEGDSDASSGSRDEGQGNSGEGAPDAAESCSALNAFLDGTLGSTANAALLDRYDRYGLQDDPVERSDAADSQDGGASPSGEGGAADGKQSGKRPLSKRERAALKKGITTEELDRQRAAAAAAAAGPSAADGATAAALEQETSGALRRSDAALARPAPSGKAGAGEAAAKAGAEAKRGHRGKQKKRAGKYGDQDEEDAELLAAFNAAQGSAKTRGDRRAERKAKKAAKKAGDMQALPYNEGLDAEAIEDTISKLKQRPDVGAGEGAAGLGRKAGGTENAGWDGSADGAAADGGIVTVDGAVEGAAVDVEDDDDDDEEGMAGVAKVANELAEVNALTGQPVDEDTLLYAVPVCAPYDVLQKYKFKVKLIPGSQKKGKASRQAVDLLSRAPYCTPREKALLQAVTDNEHVAIMIANVKLSMPGLQKAVQDQKKAKKAGRR